MSKQRDKSGISKSYKVFGGTSFFWAWPSPSPICIFPSLAHALAPALALAHVPFYAVVGLRVDDLGVEDRLRVIITVTVTVIDIAIRF